MLVSIADQKTVRGVCTSRIRPGHDCRRENTSYGGMVGWIHFKLQNTFKIFRAMAHYLPSFVTLSRQEITTLYAYCQWWVSN